MPLIRSARASGPRAWATTWRWRWMISLFNAPTYALAEATSVSGSHGAVRREQLGSAYISGFVELHRPHGIISQPLEPVLDRLHRRFLAGPCSTAVGIADVFERYRLGFGFVDIGVSLELGERGIDFDNLATAANHPEADPFDLLCHVAFNAPLRTRRERADRLKKEKKDFFDQYGPEAKAILNDLLEKYAEHGTAQFILPDVLHVPPISERGNILEIASLFGGPDHLRQAVVELQTLLYAA